MRYGEGEEPVDKTTRKGNYIRIMTILEAKRNKPMSEGVGLVKYRDSPKHLQYYKDCQAEVARIKNSPRFKDSLVNYFDFLWKPLNVLSGYVRNKSIATEFENNNYRKSFPLFSDILQQNFSTAIERERLVGKVSTVLSEILQFAGPEHEAFEVIFSYLSPDDINRIIGMNDDSQPSR